LVALDWAVLAQVTQRLGLLRRLVLLVLVLLV
jgi:hypothetical protein